VSEQLYPIGSGVGEINDGSGKGERAPVEPPLQPRAALGQKIPGVGGKADRHRDMDEGDEVQQPARRITPIPIAAVTVQTYPGETGVPEQEPHHTRKWFLLVSARPENYS
jgi:hypothetical protein